MTKAVCQPGSSSAVEQAACNRSPATVCLLTTAQPSTNPRLLKEADTLADAQFQVTVIYAYRTEWAARADCDLFASRAWKAICVGGDPQHQQLCFFYTRLRYRLGREILQRFPRRLAPENWALSRVTSELIQAAKSVPADLYIAHNLGALPAAVAGAKKHGSRAGFDAEDFHSEMVNAETAVDAVAEAVESKLLRSCDYMTAASPAMAQAYSQKYGIDRPVPVLNVFPLAIRPAAFRATDERGPLRLYWVSQTIGEGRGLEDAIRAMGLLKRPDIELYLQGNWNPGFEKTMDALIAACGLERHQVIHLPPEHPSNLVRRASAYDAGLALEPMSSRNNNITVSNKMFTYILAGNAVAATSTIGQKAIIDRIQPGGFCYAPGDIESLAGWLEKWLRDRSALDLARRAAWEWGTREYNWDVEKQKFLDVVSQALGRGR